MAALLRAAHRTLERAPAPVIGSVALAATALLGAADFATGEELSSSVFYVMPVALAAWYAGRVWGLVACAGAAATWYSADLAAGATYSATWIPVWNASVRLAFFLIIADLVRRLRTALDAQRHLAEGDALTGLANSRRFLAALDLEAQRSLRYRHPLSLAYVDLDGFKAVNDRWGHSVGDAVLARVGSILLGGVRQTDLAARLGGDEFAVLLPETSPDQARTVVDKLRGALQRGMTEGGWPVGFSIGVCSSEGAASGPDLLRTADDLMYEVKRSGRGSTAYGSLGPAAASG